ncbi:hypothetical protein Tco_0879035 [Tanacetum coccineum]
MVPLEVSMANGTVMSSKYECKDFSWEFQRVTYTTNVMNLPLRGCEMVLEIQWLSTLGWIRCKQRQRKKLVSAELSAMSVCVCRATFMQMKAGSSHSKDVEAVLKDFESVFDVPKELQPKRTHDHRIPLVLNTPPINIRPYKHPPSQKDAIELMVKELLDSGVIRNSQSPFSSPIVMIKKKDGTWRMYVDFRQLNKATVKDKFPIPIVEELIDELSGSKFFSKLDLRSGYRGKKFVLVFFDDILIYNKSLESHLDHLRQVLTVMETNSLFAKRSKEFAADKFDTWATSFLVRWQLILPKSGKERWPVPKNIKATQVFLVAMIQAPVLALPDFNKTFIVETDASRRLTTPFQAKWLPKLLGFDYEISYKSGSDNLVANALSRISSGVELNELSQTYKKDKYALVDEILRRKGKIVVGDVSKLKSFIIHHYHADAMEGHSGTNVTLHRYGYCKYHKKRAKTEQKRTWERKEYTRDGKVSTKGITRGLQTNTPKREICTKLNAKEAHPPPNDCIASVAIRVLSFHPTTTIQDQDSVRNKGPGSKLPRSM